MLPRCIPIYYCLSLTCVDLRSAQLHTNFASLLSDATTYYTQHMEFNQSVLLICNRSRSATPPKPTGHPQEIDRSALAHPHVIHVTDLWPSYGRGPGKLAAVIPWRDIWLAIDLTYEGMWRNQSSGAGSHGRARPARTSA